MRRVVAAAVIMTLLAVPLAAEAPRVASDFEIAKVEAQLARERDRLAIAAAYMNLGDLRASRSESNRSREAYLAAEKNAEALRHEARRRGDLARYATATAYSALACAKLGRRADAWDRFSEATRYAGDSATIWNLAASGMLVAGLPRKASGAARNALAIAERDPSTGIEVKLDVSIYRYTLASALIATGDSEAELEAARLLERVVSDLDSDTFAPIRSRIRDVEAFEILSSARGDVESYLSLAQRSRLRLAAIYEEQGRAAEARSQYEAALRSRRDDATALAGMARLAKSAGDRDRWFAEAFTANPYSWALLSAYEDAARDATLTRPTGKHPGDLVRAILFDLAHDRVPSQETLGSLSSLSNNDVVIYLNARALAARGDRDAARAIAAEAQCAVALRELESRMGDEATLPPAFASAGHVNQPAENDLAAVASSWGRLSPEGKARLDALTFESRATFDAAETREGTTVLASGRIGGIAFRFATPTAFRGEWAARVPLTLRYRIVASEESDGPMLIVEPLGVSR
ncbi:MAG: tetratricopeptide repeat protein [Thermoanaerobaculia bacterium]